jgi:phenylpropionate dioxygenase-like ring-hydroxylating dioxygenase large terminal subunit
MAADTFRNPVAAYTSQERFEREHGTLFRRYPLLTALSCELPAPGSYLTQHELAVPILLVRGRDGVARAFANVCRHRGARVVDGCGAGARGFTCPYHAWTYDLDGRLARIPGEEGFAGLDREAYGLRALPCAERHGLIFVVPDPEARSTSADVESHLDGLTDELASYGLESWHHFATQSLQPRINWKIAVDTFLEAYHLAALHRQTVAPIFFGNLCLSDDFGLNHRMVAVRKSFADVDSDERTGREFLTHTIELYTLFPNTVFIHQADHVEVWRMFPDRDRVDACTVTLSLFAPEDVTSDAARRHWQANFDLALQTVDTEDFRLGEGIQNGFRSGAQTHVTYGRNEPALIHFHRSLNAALGAL